MAKIKDILVKPTRRKPVRVTALDGETILPFELRILPGEDTAAIEDRALASVKGAGGADPKPDNATYKRALMVETILVAATDADSPLDKPEPFFSTAAEVRHFLDDARIAHVYQEQRAYQSEFAPVPEKLDFEDFIQLTWAATKEAQKGGDPERPFVGLPYRKLTSFCANAASTLTAPTLPQLLFGSLTPPGQDGTSDSSSSSSGSASADS